MDINKINNVVLASLLSTLVGILPFAISMAYDASSRGHSLIAYTSLVELSRIYFGVVFNAFLVVLILGAPAYLLFKKFNIANYISAAIFGGGFTLIIGSFQNPWVFISISGFIIGPIFHFFYLKLEKRHEQTI
jgi:hypothetical protein